MLYSELWARTTFSKYIAKSYIQKYGHLLKWKPYKEEILEIGCADGSVTRQILFPHIRNHVRKLVAVDKLQGMIDYANKENNTDQIDFETMDIMDRRSVDEFNNKFDHIFSLMVSHWIPDTKLYLNNLKGMLKDDGQIFLLQFANDNPPKYCFDKQLSEGIWSQYLPQDPVITDLTDQPKKYLTKLLDEVGFKVEVCECHSNTWVEEEFEDFVISFVHMYEHLDKIPEELKQDYFKYHVRNCCEKYQYMGEPKKYKVTYDTILAIATKVI